MTTIEFNPIACAGVLQVMEVLLITVGEVQFEPPIVTVAPEMKLVPESVMVVPPAILPLFGLTLVTLGLAMVEYALVFVAVWVSVFIKVRL